MTHRIRHADRRIPRMGMEGREGSEFQAAAIPAAQGQGTPEPQAAIAVRDQGTPESQVAAAATTNFDLTGDPGTSDGSTGIFPNFAGDGSEPKDGSAEQRPKPSGESGEQAGEHTEPRNEHRQGGDYDRAGAEQDSNRLNARLDEVSRKLAELRGKSDNLDSRVDEIQRDIEDLKARVKNLARSGGGQSPGATFQPVAQLSVIEDDALAAAKEDDSTPRGFFKRLRSMFRGIWKLLWQLLSRLGMVKEWSLTGELGPAPLLGKVGVSVTFGR
jgi:hypothetical protein